MNETANDTADETVNAFRRFSPVPSSVAGARRFVAEALPGTAKDVLDSLETMVSELASNCVVHAGTEFDVSISRSRGVLHIEVTDFGTGQPSLQQPTALGSKGRGLVIVDALADDWGVNPSPGRAGKTVWFTVATLQNRDDVRSSRGHDPSASTR